MTTSAPVTPALGGVFRWVMPVRWGDMDAQNHVNNTIYFRYFEEARVQLFAQAGLSMPARKVGMLAHASCDFLKPLTYPSTVVIKLVLTRVGRSSMGFDAIVECLEEPGVEYARGSHVIVGADIETGRPKPWTPAELAAFAPCFVN